MSNVEIRTVELTENMVRAIAKQAEAERDRRAKIIHAEAEFQASQTLVNAAQILSSIPAAMQLRYLRTLGGDRRRRIRRSSSPCRSTSSSLFSTFLTMPANRPGATAFVLQLCPLRMGLWRYWRQEMAGRDPAVGPKSALSRATRAALDEIIPTSGASTSLEKRIGARRCATSHEPLMGKLQFCRRAAKLARLKKSE